MWGWWSRYCFCLLFYVLFMSIVLFYVLFACKCVLYYCHRVSTQLQLTNTPISITALPPRKSPGTPAVQETGWSPGLAWTGVQQRKSLVPTGVWNPNHPARTKTLFWLHYPSPHYIQKCEKALFELHISNCYIYIYIYIYIQGIHKRMVRFEKVTRNLFLTLHGHNVHRQQRKLSKFLKRYQQFASHA